MKKLNKIALFALSALTLVGCADLDTEPLGKTVTADQKEEVLEADPTRIEAGVTAICSNFTVYGAVGGEDQHNDFGYPAIMMLLDHRGTDLVSFDTGYNWFSYPLIYSDVQNNGVGTAIIWYTLFNQIFTANAILGVLDPETEDPTTQFYLAQALAIRAFDYFNLVQVYQHTYVGHESAPGVPLITEKNAAEVATSGVARATVEDTYTFILDDINKAIELLEATDVERADKRYVSLDVAYGIRARINLVMNNWQAAYDDAVAAINASDSKVMSINEAGKPAFIDINEKSWMWGVLITDKDRVATTGICNFPSHMGSFNYGYASVGAWRLINKKLFAAIPETDVRRNWFLDAECNSATLTKAQLDYVKNSAKCPAYTQVKYAAMGDEMGTDDNSCDVPLMRIEEMYYIAYEAQAMNGDVPGAVAALNKFVNTYRDTDYLCEATTKEEAQEAIWNQRRIEFWGEGLSWFDIKRLNKGVNRLGGGFPETAVFNFEPNADELLLPIPHAEEQYNKLIGVSETVSVPQPIPDETEEEK